MPRVCWYFQIHQPWRLRPYSIFDVGNRHDYFATDSSLDFDNETVLKKVADKSYRPMFALLEELLTEYQDFVFALSFSGVVLEQFQEFAPDLISNLQRMVKTQRVELLGETYYHSLASLYDPPEFADQVALHTQTIKSLFGEKPNIFRNTELIYTDQVAKQVEQLGFKGMLAEGADQVLQGRSPTKLYQSPNGELPLLLKHYQLSDDIAFRFSQRSWAGWPLTADKFEYWLTQPFQNDDIINLFMDFETFGEHQWESEGIFPFFRELIKLLNSNQAVEMVTPTQAVTDLQPVDIFSSDTPISWADVDRDITAWVGNPLQHDVINRLYSLGDKLQHLPKEGAASLLADWRRLQTSDHFYYMCTKWANDGDVHAYFSPYQTPYEAYNNYNNVLADLLTRIE